MDRIIVIAYGLFMLVGAFFGWRAGSKISLYAGLGSATLVFLGAWITTLHPKNGFLFIAVLAGALTLVFVKRFLQTQQFMPSGMLMGVTLLFFIFAVIRYIKL